LRAVRGAVICRRTHRELKDEDIRQITSTYHAWRGDGKNLPYKNVSGFCYSAEIEEIARRNFDLNPGCYVGTGIELATEENLKGGLDTSAEEAIGSCSEGLEIQQRVLDTLTDYRQHLRNCLHSVNGIFRSGTLKDLAVASRSTINPADFPRQIFQLYSIPAFDAGGVPDYVSGNEILSHKCQINGECILVSKLNPRKHRVWLVRPKSKWAICSTEFVILKPRKPIYLDYLYLLCSSREFQAYLMAHATGSTGSRQRVKTPDVMAAPALVPSDDIAESLSKIVGPIHLRMQSVTDELGRLLAFTGTLFDLLIASHRTDNKQKGGRQ
jgi:hypothetical protein